jgi:uncharacterized membrane protein YozB (DUF420 family)
MLRVVLSDPKLAYWTVALANMLAIVALALAAVGRARRREIAGHRRLMLVAASLVGLFLVSYVAKVWLLGREQLALWAPRYVWTLRFHETCVAVMVLAGSRAIWLGARSGFTDAARARSHRRAGRAALISAALGVASAGYVLFGMFERSS